MILYFVIVARVLRELTQQKFQKR